MGAIIVFVAFLGLGEFLLLLMLLASIKSDLREENNDLRSRIRDLESRLYKVELNRYRE